MFNRIRISVYACFQLIFHLVASGQELSLSGRIIQGETRQPLEYTNIILYRSTDSTQVAGTVSDRRGMFTIPLPQQGLYYLDILFLGYERKRIDLIITNESVDLGDIALSPTSIFLGDVIVEGERPSLTYEVDKKVIEVGELSSTISGTVAEVLENIPSIQVDLEGNVSLRGSTNLIVLIDGRPTVLDPQEALQQIPASAVARVEIITNPSAKYDPEGSAGVINIVMARRRQQGVSGIVTGNVGLRDKYGGDVAIEYRTSTVNILAGVDHNNRFFLERDRQENSYMYQNSATFTHAAGESRRGRFSWGIRSGIEYKPTSDDLVSLNARRGKRSNEQSSFMHHERRTEPSLQSERNLNAATRMRGGDFTSINVGYQRKLGTQGHNLKADLELGFDRSNEATVTELHNGPLIMNGKRTTEGGPETDVEGRIEYTVPLTETMKFEAGYVGEFETSREQTGLDEYDATAGSYRSLAQFSNNVRYVTNEHAFYSLYGSEGDGFGFQAGLRGEYTQRRITLQRSGETFTIDRWDIFPTLHTNYNFGGANQILASYTRRINRPGGGELEPFETWLGTNNVRRGNPNLRPEFVDSYELAAQATIDGLTLTAELYRNITHHKIEDVRTVYAPDVTLQTSYNIGSDYSTGTELLFNFDLLQGWNINLIGNLYRYEIKGEILGEPFFRMSTHWSGRINSSLKFGTTHIQVNTRLESATVSSQGRREGFVSVDVGLRHELLNRQLAVILQARDLFGTEKREFFARGVGFSSYSLSERESPVVMLTLRYAIGGFKSNEQSREEEREDRDEEGFEER